MNISNIYGEKKWDNFNGQSPLIEVFRKFHPLTPELEAIINEHTFPVEFGKNKHIASPSKRNKYLFLILSGATYGYIKLDKQKITTWFAIENDFAGTINNLWEDAATDEYIETIEQVMAIAIPHSMSKMMFEQYPVANLIGRKLTEMYLKAASERALLSRMPGAAKRYERFVAMYPRLINRIPLKCVASFIGVRLETLSRIRNGSNTKPKTV
ncbi:Crp/Fnr family transcriptional regulator [Pedobacter sandarakinus]|uniref:Crp/Fnr family transcriptional regulator n=1 Tax=Pedobacter sandarakinus TaxID=353156 RepID=UPI0022467AB9|nr:Crp/Fnr family transcriptional regulator [Pedobacter sandarakinus]MCX2575894.1 Crp/Fnr family transcriptional regulator [Pedobacter sandarakinus]